MKLLDRQKLNEQVTQQKRNQIDAGLFLAKKVDALREEVQDEQKKHDDAMEAIKKEEITFTNEFLMKKDSMDRQIIEREEKLRELRLPLDAEWKRVNELVELNNKNFKTISEFSFKVEKKEEELTKKEKSLSKREEQIQLFEEKVKEAFEKAQSNKEESYIILVKAQENEEKITKNLEIRAKAVSERETNVAFREIDVENRMKHALTKEESNRKETIRIESKQRQLKIALDLLKNVPNNNPNTEC